MWNSMKDHVFDESVDRAIDDNMNKDMWIQINEDVEDHMKNQDGIQESWWVESDLREALTDDTEEQDAAWTIFDIEIQREFDDINVATPVWKNDA